jgi:hypothetical protein
MGQIDSGLPADGNNNGQIDSGEHDVWREHFGESLGSGSAGASPSRAAVPEPATALLVVLGAVVGS